MPPEVLCPACRQPLPAEATRCSCGHALSGQSAPYDAPPPVIPRQGFIDKLIPSQNPPALLAYYVGIFGLIAAICILAVPIPIVAIVAGFKGLSRCRETPGLPGRGHAIAGIVLGFVSIAVGAAVLALIFLSR